MNNAEQGMDWTLVTVEFFLQYFKTGDDDYVDQNRSTKDDEQWKKLVRQE